MSAAKKKIVTKQPPEGEKIATKKRPTSKNIEKGHLKWKKPDPAKPGNEDTRVKDAGK